MLYILEDVYTARGSGIHFLAIEAGSAKEAEELAKEYLKEDDRIIRFPLLHTKMIAHKSLCDVVITKDNVETVRRKRVKH